jgi:two-component system, NarL family, sensor kinase
MESESQVKLYFGIITAMLALVIITGGFIAMVIRYQKRLLRKQQQLLRLDAQHKKELLKISVESAEANRQQIARDVHDEIGSIFSTLAISVNRFNDGSVSSNEHIESSRNLVQLGIDSVRRISHAIVPFELDLLGLEQTLEHHFETIHTLTGIQINFDNKAPLDQLNKGAALAIYRIVQELSSNSLKYAQANQLVIKIATSVGFIQIQYSDDGVGANLDGKPGKPGIGLKNIESRVLLLDGVVSFKTQPGKGFACNISLPFQNNTLT